MSEIVRYSLRFDTESCFALKEMHKCKRFIAVFLTTTGRERKEEGIRWNVCQKRENACLVRSATNWTIGRKRKNMPEQKKSWNWDNFPSFRRIILMIAWKAPRFKWLYLKCLSVAAQMAILWSILKNQRSKLFSNRFQSYLSGTLLTKPFGKFLSGSYF